MASGETIAAIRGMQTLYQSGSLAGMSDRELLSRCTGREAEAAEAAFHAIVVRHGPMVLGVCKRLLRDPCDVDDAFQATFLVLVRKAQGVRVNDSLGRWLYGVSRRVAARARSTAMRRMAREGARIEVEPASPDRDQPPEELLEALEEEVGRLPWRYRSAIVLCDLGGLPHEAAARELGCAVGTVASRVSRGREQLRTRLARRGLAPVALASPSVPAALHEATVRAAVGWISGGQATAGAVSASVVKLVQSVLKELSMMKWTMIGVGFVSLVILGGIGTIAAQRPRADDPPPRLPSADLPPSRLPSDDLPPPEMPSAAAKPKAAERPGVDRPLDAPPPFKIGDRMNIEVLEALPGRAIFGERIVRPDGTISLGYYGDVYVFGLNRNQVKVKVIERLVKYLPDDVLGLFEQDEAGRQRAVAPVDSDRVFIDEVYEGTPRQNRNSADQKLEEILNSVNNLSLRMRAAPGPRGRAESGNNAVRPPQAAAVPGVPRPASADAESGTARRLADHERRLADLEHNLDRVIKAFESATSGDAPK